MRDLTTTQESLLAGPATRPVFLVELEIDPGHPEFLSTAGTVTVDGQLYTGADVGLREVDNWSRAVVSVRATADRVASMLTGGYRGAAARVLLLPIFHYPEIVEQGYVELGYAANGVQQADPVALLDGVMVACDVEERVEISIVHRASTGFWSPRLRITNQWFNHLPQPGTILEWQGEKYILEAS